MTAFFQTLLQLTGAARATTLAGAAPDHAFADADVARLQRVDGARMARPVSGTVDEPTWQGMLLAPYFARLTVHASIFGKQQLYQDLREGVTMDQRAALEARLIRLEDGAVVAAQAPVLQALREAETELTAMLFDDHAPMVPAWAGKCWLLAVALVLSVVAAAWSPLAWLATFFCLFQMVALQARYHAIIDAWDRQRVSLQRLLRACSLAAASDEASLQAFATLGRQAGRSNRALHRQVAQAVSMVGVYLDWFLQANIEHYFKSVRLVHEQRAFLQQCFYVCARLDADATLARHRATTATCWARRGDGVQFDDAVHPLLETAAPLSVDLRGGGAFISGQNGVGKSTLLRTVGLNLLTARAFGFCYAARAHCPMALVVASMQSEDSLLGGASLYMAELARARELLAAANARPADGAVIFIIDEIFRGTNHLESVSSAAAVLDELAARQMVLVSSHNVVLASLLAHRLAPLCVARDDDGALRVTPGVLANTNGISLLAQHGFGAEIDAKARCVFAWLETFLAQPPGGASVLAPTPVAWSERAA